MAGKIEIGEKARVQIKWKVKPIDYSNEKENEICSKFAKKYGIPKAHVRVVPSFIQLNSDGKEVALSDGIIGDIQDPKFQQEVMKKYIIEHEIQNYDFDKIIEIDDSINNLVSDKDYEGRKTYVIKWVKWSNFESYGPDNFIDLTTLKGLVLISSEPANQGGKSTFCLDLFRFLLFGKVTARGDDWVLSKTFNKYLPEATEMSVEGCICIDGVDYVIKRTVKRPTLKKRTEKSKVTQTVSYYKYVNGEYIELDEDGETMGTGNRETNKIIKDALGNERDFDLMICISSDNLKKLISLKDTERGRLISRWVGLLPLEDKDKLAREMYNGSVSKNLLMNKYNKEDVIQSRSELKATNIELEARNKTVQKKIEESNKKIEGFNIQKDTLLQSKAQINDVLTKTDVQTVENNLAAIIEEGKRKRAEKEDNERKLYEVHDVQFDETQYKLISDKCMNLNAQVATIRANCKNAQEQIKLLQNSEYCPTCGARLKNVDNSAAITDMQNKLYSMINEGKAASAELTESVNLRNSMEGNRATYNEMIRLKLLVDKNKVDIENIAGRYRECNRLLKDIKANKDAIENNNRIDNSLRIVNENISAETQYVRSLTMEIAQNTADIKTNKTNIENDEKIIAQIEKEEKIVRNWKIYLEMIGKNGISKMVLRTALPFINGELRSLLTDACDFDVEVAIDDRNDVSFYIIHDGVRDSLSSGSGFEQTVASLALRSVLAKVSTFSRPSFVVLDEVFGGVADENYDEVKRLLDKITPSYKQVFDITHLKAIADWHTSNIVIEKKDNVSRLSIR